MKINNPISIKSPENLAFGELYLIHIGDDNCLCVFLGTSEYDSLQHGVLTRNGEPSFQLVVNDEYSEKCISFGTDWLLHIHPTTSISWEKSPSQRDLVGKLLIAQSTTYITFEEGCRTPKTFGFLDVVNAKYGGASHRSFGMGAAWAIWKDEQHMATEGAVPLFRHAETE